MELITTYKLVSIHNYMLKGFAIISWLHSDTRLKLKPCHLINCLVVTFRGLIYTLQ